MKIYTTREVLAEEAAKLNHNGEPLSAICLSGGGIRSAAFCLGVIQAFAARNMLHQFHYLSTVSGGGYIGGWLTRCIKAWGGDVLAAEQHLNIYQAIGFKSDDTPDAQAALVRKAPDEPRELDTLRRYTNYLTPSPGFASADTWAGVVLWLRNTLINWAVFLPLAIAVASVPIAYTGLVGALGALQLGSLLRGLLMVALGGVGLACLFTANFTVCRHLPTHDFHRVHVQPGTTATGLNSRQVWWKIGVFSLGWSFLVPLAMAPALRPAQSFGPAHAVFFAAATPPAPKDAAAKPAACPAKPAPSPPVLFASCPPPRTSLFRRQLFGGPWLALLPICDLIICVLAYVTAGLVSYRKRHELVHQMIDALNTSGATNPADTAITCEALNNELKAERAAFRKNLFAWAASGLISSVLLLIGLHLSYRKDVFWIALAGPLWVVGAELMRSAAYVAVRRHGLFSGLDREWLARLSGNRLRVVLAAVAAGAAAILLPRLILDDGAGTYAAIVAFSSGPLAALIGKLPLTQFSHGSTTGSTPFWRKPATLVAALAAVFAGAILMLCGRLVIELAELLAPVTYTILRLGGCPASPAGDFTASFVSVGVLGVVFAVLARVTDHYVNLNRFSLHAVYRNRLIRAFLGTASSAHYKPGVADPEDHTPDQVPDAFTGFTPTDNIRMSEAFERTGGQPHRLFPVINVTLNRTAGSDTARAERKGEPFTITPLQCGCAVLDDRQGAYIATKDYAGGEQESGPADSCAGLTLGTAMAISGAAVSPNMGYNSSPFAAFLMTLFNLRLGAWLPNPAAKNLSEPPQTFFSRAGPKYAIPTLMRELSGRTDDTGAYVYLSDGGHFDNLGLYEMLRRRCAYIVVVDAGADGKYDYFDLGHTLQMASIDLGIQVTFAPAIKTEAEILSVSAAYASVTYPPRPPDEKRATGQIIYIKPWLPPDAPIELLAYKRMKPNFPHESTADQFFTESDFESYRRLGAYLANNLLTKTLTSFTIENLFRSTAPR